MTTRQLRRAAEHQARKAARKAGFPVPQSTTTPAVAQATAETETDTLAAIASASVLATEEPSIATISPARLSANRANAQFSTGAKSPATKAISAQNHAIHGLARHQNGAFKLLSTEDPIGFEALKQSLFDEHLPSTETESILVNGMAESHWLSARAQRLQDTCMSPDTGDITDDKKFSLYMRYQTTHTRAFHKSLNDLLKLRGEKRKAELGFEAQKRKEEEQRHKSERHEMKKQVHEVELLKKDAQARLQIGLVAEKICSGRQNIRLFEEQYEAELAKQGLTNEQKTVTTQAA